MFDCRVRQIWITPLDLQKLALLFEGTSEVLRSSEIFLERSSGLGITFRRWLFYVGLADLSLWALIAVACLREPRGVSPLPRLERWLPLAPAVLAFAPLVMSAVLPKYMLGLEENILVRHGINRLRPGTSPARLASLPYHYSASYSAGPEHDHEERRAIRRPPTRQCP